MRSFTVHDLIGPNEHVIHSVHYFVTAFVIYCKINETSKLSSVIYGSWGRGGGSNGAGGVRGQNYLNSAFRTADGLVDFEKIQAYNEGKATVVVGGVPTTRTQINGNYQNSSSTGRTGSGTTSSPYVYNTTSGISKISSINFNSVFWLNEYRNFPTPWKA